MLNLEEVGLYVILGALGELTLEEMGLKVVLGELTVNVVGRLSIVEPALHTAQPVHHTLTESELKRSGKNQLGYCNKVKFFAFWSAAHQSASPSVRQSSQFFLTERIQISLPIWSYAPALTWPGLAGLKTSHAYFRPASVSTSGRAAPLASFDFLPRSPPALPWFPFQFHYRAQVRPQHSKYLQCI